MASSDDDDEFRGGMFGGGARTSSYIKTNTPVLDNFSDDLKRLVQRDQIKYYPREKELNLLLKFLLKREKSHTFIVGEIGTGRHTLIKCAIQAIESGAASPSLNNLSFKAVDFNSLVAGTKYRGQYEERFQAISNEIEKTSNLIIYFESLSNFLFEDDTWNYGYTLQALIGSKAARVVAVLTNDEYQIFQKKFKSLNRYVNIINLFPPNKDETLSMLDCHIPRYQNEYSCNLDSKNLARIVELSDLYLPDEFQPSKSLLVLEEVCLTKGINITKYLTPNSPLAKLLNEQKLLDNQLKEITTQKNIIVKSQKYEEAAQLRDKEKKLIDKSENLLTEIEIAKKSTYLVVLDEEIIYALSEITGINPQDIRDKKNAPKRLANLQIAENSTNLPKFEFSQAQSILHGDQITIKKGTAFVLLPHTADFDSIYEIIIRPAAEANGLIPLKADNIYQPGNILSQVWQEIRSAEVIIADVSGHNPNVIFELGLCYGIQRCPIILTTNPEELPFNLRNLRYIHYFNTSSGGNDLKKKLTSTIEEFLSAVRIQS